jgi:hypothetical protein
MLAANAVCWFCHDAAHLALPPVSASPARIFMPSDQTLSDGTMIIDKKYIFQELYKKKIRVIALLYIIFHTSYSPFKCFIFNSYLDYIYNKSL